MSEEQIRQKLKAIENARKSKIKDRATIEGMLKKLRTSKKLEQPHVKTIATLVELAFEDKQDIEDSLFSLWEQQLNGELRLLKIEKTIEQLEKAIEWSDQNK